MKTVILAAAAVAAMLAVAPLANAAQIMDVTPPAADGSFSGTFSNTGIAAGDFSNTFTFTMPTGFAGATITSIMSSLATNVDFTSVTLNGSDFKISQTGDVEFRFLKDLPVTSGPQTLVVNGKSGGAGSYSGTLSFALAAVPEPASWAMMILGFGGIGGVLRRRRSDGPAVVPRAA